MLSPTGLTTHPVPDVRGKALAMALIALTGGLGSLAEITQGNADEPHGPIVIDGDQELRSNACACITDTDVAGTPSDPYVIEDWRITEGETALVVKNIRNEHFLIRDNTLETTEGIHLINTGDRGQVVDNLINFEDRGVYLQNTQTWMADNTVQSVNHNWRVDSVAVDVDGGAPTIEGNYLSMGESGIEASSSSPTIEANELVGFEDAVLLTDSTEARLANNTIRLAEHWGVHLKDSADARLVSNEIREGEGGIVSKGAKLFMQDNLVTNQKADAVRFVESTVTMFRNDIVNNWRGAYGSTDSDVTIVDNTFRDNGDEAGPNDNAALRLSGSEGRVDNNTIDGNDIGIRLDHSIIELTDNNLTDNRWGMSIPYSSKGSIPLMAGNTINGVNVDGTLDESEQRIFYEEVDRTVEGQLIDSGHSDGYFGTLFKQGAVVVYDSQDMTIQDNRFEYNERAIGIQASNFVRVQDNQFTSNHEAVVAVDTGETFIKDNICEIEIDPPDSVCFRAGDGFTTVRANVIQNVDIGVQFTLDARGEIVDNDIKSTTKAGLQLEGYLGQDSEAVVVAQNEIEGNARGAVLSTFQGHFEANTIGNSSKAGVVVDQRTSATFEANTIVHNEGGGVVDPCYESSSMCSTGVFVDNKIKHNAEIGVKLGDGGSFRGDVIADNEAGVDVDGFVQAHDVELTGNADAGATVDGHLALHDANATANGKQGVVVRGELSADGVNASANGDTGIVARGQTHLEGVVAQGNDEDGAHLMGQAYVADANASANGEAGFRLGGTVFVVEECEASFNANGVVMTEGRVEVDPHVPVPDVPSIEIPDVPDTGDDEEEDPLWMHECDIVGNEDFSIRANVEAIVNATYNFWGKAGPRVDSPTLPGSNVHSPNVLSTPYYESRDHEVLCAVPATEAHAGTPQGCVDPR